MKSSSTVSAILFDLGNVFVRIDPDKAIGQLANTSPFPFQKILDYFISSETVQLFELGSITSLQFFERVKHDLQLSVTMDQLRDLYCSIFTPVQPMVEFLSKSRDRYACYLLSNTNEWHIEFCEQHYPFMHWFRSRFYSHQLHLLKPDHLIFEKVLTKINIPPEKILFTDDRQENTQAADALGFQTIQFTAYEAFLVEWNTLINKK